MIILVGQSTLKSYHKIQIVRELFRLAVSTYLHEVLRKDQVFKKLVILFIIHKGCHIAFSHNQNQTKVWSFGSEKVAIKQTFPTLVLSSLGLPPNHSIQIEKVCYEGIIHKLPTQKVSKFCLAFICLSKLVFEGPIGLQTFRHCFCCCFLRFCSKMDEIQSRSCHNLIYLVKCSKLVSECLEFFRIYSLPF